MEFGRVPEIELNKIDFSLPIEPAFNKKVLKNKPVKNPKVYLGCAKWGRAEWVGKVYPLKTREKDFLDHYVQHYNSIELNATHYKIYGTEGIKKWADKAAGRDFVFCPKMYQGITHRGRLKGKEFITTEFFRGLLTLGKHVGPIFIQVSESFSPKRKDELFDFLRTMPTDMQFFLEVRDPDWYAKELVSKELFTTLRELKIGAVITDTAGRRDCAHMHLPIASAFVRYVGNSLHPTDFARADGWVQRIKTWLQNGVKEIYFFMHMHDEATSPEMTVYLVEQLNSICGLDLQRPRFLDIHKVVV